MPYNDPPNRTQAEAIRKIAELGGMCDVRMLPMHPGTVKRLINKGYIKDDEWAIGPKGGLYRRLVLTNLAREWLTKYPKPGSMFRQQGEGYVWEGRAYSGPWDGHGRLNPGWIDMGVSLVPPNLKLHSLVPPPNRKRFDYRATWASDAGTWTVTILGTGKVYTTGEQAEMQTEIARQLFLQNKAWVGHWDWSRVTIVDGESKPE